MSNETQEVKNLEEGNKIAAVVAEKAATAEAVEKVREDAKTLAKPELNPYNEDGTPRRFYRTTGMTYTVINAHQAVNPDTKQPYYVEGVTAQFRSRAPGAAAIWDPSRGIDDYVAKEVSSGRLAPDDEVIEKRKKNLMDIAIKHVTRHTDFLSGIVWLEPTKAEVAEQIRKQIESAEAELKTLTEKAADPDKITDEEFKERTTPKPQKVKISGGGVTKGGSTSAAGKRG